MANENLLPFDPNKVPDLIKQGKIRIVATPTLSPKESLIGGLERVKERAKQLFGEDFLGEDAIHVMEQKCQAAGISVAFEIPQIGGFDNRLLEIAKSDEAQGRARMVVLRPEFMVVNRERKPVNLLNLRELFRKERKEGRNTVVSYGNNPFGTGAIFYKQNWHDNEDFVRKPLRTGFGLPTKDIIANSLNRTWNGQQTLLLPGERRREANETAWDSILYYANTGKKLLEYTWDWGDSLAQSGGRVGVGGFDSYGLGVRYWNPESSDEGIGVCPSR